MDIKQPPSRLRPFLWETSESLRESRHLNPLVVECLGGMLARLTSIETGAREYMTIWKAMGTARHEDAFDAVIDEPSAVTLNSLVHGASVAARSKYGDVRLIAMDVPLNPNKIVGSNADTAVAAQRAVQDVHHHMERVFAQKMLNLP